MIVKMKNIKHPSIFKVGCFIISVSMIGWAGYFLDVFNLDIFGSFLVVNFLFGLVTVIGGKYGDNDNLEYDKVIKR
jgi:hypothetical protein